MNRFKFIATLLIVGISSAPLLAKDYYVSRASGSNKNDGAKTTPFKNIQKAVDVAAAGDTIHVAEGNYYGNLDVGYIDIKKYLSIIGGYSSDFSQRNVLKYKTFVQPDFKSTGTSSSKGLLEIYVRGNRKATVLIDGLIFDKGMANGYIGKPQNDPKASWPEGVETSGLVIPPTKGFAGNFVKTKPKAFSPADPAGFSTTNAMIHGDVEGQVTIQNCVFVNASHFGIQMGNIGGNFRVLNNVFVNSRMAAIEIRSMNQNPGEASMEVANNTILFTWSRLNDMGDMGYGVRFMSGINGNVHHNIIGCSTFSALDRTYVDANKDKEAQRKTSASDNIFFMNRQADITLPSGGGKFMRVFAKDFDDVEQLTSSSGNKELADTSVINSVVNKAYLKGFINLTYSETTEYNPNSSANTLRSVLGMNQQGTMNSKASMFANRYPIDEVYKLFGAIGGYGAQLPK